MPKFALHALDWFFLLFHTLLCVFNVTGWAWRKTRRWNLVCLGLTAASWLLMGIWYGIGYCICTDWHWQVREALGHQTEAKTYIQFLVQRLTGYLPGSEITQRITGVAFVCASILSLCLNYRDFRARQKK